MQKNNISDFKILNGKNLIDLSVSKDICEIDAEVKANIGAKTGKKVNPSLFGINMLFFTEKNTVRADETYQTSMKYLDTKVMRYPGGTAGDNYLWKKKDIYATEWYPGKSNPDDMDTDGFLDFSAKFGAERMLVINYRSYIKMNDMDAFYQDAEDWVRYVNIEKKAGVKYWELGNELYFKENSEVRCQFTPEQLGAHYLELRKRLKAVDPNIQLGLTLHKNWADVPPNVVDNWNIRLMKAVNCDVDFIIIHIYSTPSEDYFEAKGADIRDKVKAIRKGIAEIGGRSDIPFLMTEWNYGASNKIIEAQKVGHLVGLAQGFLEIIDSDFELATIWPLMNSSTRMIKPGDYTLAPAGEMFYWLNSELAGCDIVDIKTDKITKNVELKAFLSPDGKQLRIVALNRSQTREERAEISLKGYITYGQATLNTLMSNSVLDGNNVALNDSNMVLNEQQIPVVTDTVSFKLPPVSASILHININN